jgi:transposase-like protein
MASIVRAAFSIPLRVTAKVLYVAHGLRVSHEYVRGREVDAGSRPVKAPPGVGSGVYACDEQHLKILGKEMFRHAVVDSAGEVIAEEVHHDKSEDTIADFWKRSLDGRPLKAVVTDLDRKYPPALERVVHERFPVLPMGAKPVMHQLCTLHAQRWFSRECRDAERSARKKEGVKKSYDTERSLLRLCFCLDRPEQVNKVVKGLPDDHRPWVEKLMERIEAGEVTARQASRQVFDVMWRWRSPYAARAVSVLKSFMEKWECLTHFYDHPEIPRTSNEVERLFSRTNPERVKRRFRTEAGIMSHLSAKYAARRTIQMLLAA